jgi:hypothetical protein
MNIYKFFSPVLIAALALIILPAISQAQERNRYSTPIAMVADYDGNGPTEKTSQFGVMEPLGLRRNQQVPITLNVPRSWANSPVGFAPLDGGEVIASPNLQVDSDGAVGFAFRGGDTPGLYRVLVTVGGEQYEMQFYVGAITPDAAACP